MKVTIYANYGVLAHEYQTIYTVYNPHCYAVTYDMLTVVIPDEFRPRLNDMDDVVIDIPGMTCSYMLSDVLGSVDGFPAICWYDGNKNQSVMLRVVRGAEHLV